MLKSNVYVTVYTLEDSKGRIFYVGVCENIIKRLSCHLSYAKNSKTALYKHIRKNKIKPILKEVETIFLEYSWYAFDVEKYWIDQFRQWGFDLKNHYQNLSRKKIKTKK